MADLRRASRSSKARTRKANMPAVRSRSPSPDGPGSVLGKVRHEQRRPLHGLPGHHADLDAEPPQQCNLMPGQIRTRDVQCVCPRGTRLQSGRCRPKGTRLVRGQCVTILRVPTCKRGEVLRNGRCVTVQPLGCPRGTVGTPPNCRRLLEPIGNIPPAEAEERYYAMLDEPTMAA
jgi:hypothetical protein